MIILVDYYNLPELLQRRELHSIVETILERIGVEHLRAFGRIEIRLYGGWFEGKNLTHAAQRLSAATNVFPRKFTVAGMAKGAPMTLDVVAQVELAQSMKIDSRTPLEGTYRQHGLPTGLRCKPHPYSRCANPSNCRLFDVYDFIEKESCQEPRCNIATSDVLWRAEQKLVDSMIVADLIYFASKSDAIICLISSDDDLWPGVKSALMLGCKVIHIHTIENRPTPTRYSRTAGPNYKQLSLR